MEIYLRERGVIERREQQEEENGGGEERRAGSDAEKVKDKLYLIRNGYLELRNIS